MVSAEPSWFVNLADDTDRPVRVFGLPQAGGGCATFAELAGLTSPDIALFGLNPPGRQARFSEPSITDIDLLVSQATTALRTHADRPYVLFGYCSGALLAFLVARAAAAADLRPPSALVVASYPAPHLAKPDPDLHRLPSDAFWSAIIEQGGMPAALAEQTDYREIFEEPLRADFALLGGFRQVDAPPLDVPVVALYGTDDPLLSEPEMKAWSLHTTARFRLEPLAATHWLLGEVPNEIIAILEDECRR